MRDNAGRLCVDMGGCQNYGPFLGPYYNTAPIIQGTQNGTLILTTTHMRSSPKLASGKERIHFLHMVTKRSAGLHAFSSCRLLAPFSPNSKQQTPDSKTWTPQGPIENPESCKTLLVVFNRIRVRSS